MPNFKDEPVRYQRRKQFLPFVLFRLVVTVILLLVFGLGVYQAFRYFSGVDPATADPKTLLTSFLSEGGVVDEIAGSVGITIPERLRMFGQSKINLPEDEGFSGVLNGVNGLQGSKNSQKNNQSEKVLRFVVVADSHNDNAHLQKVLTQAKDEGAKFVIGLGDFSEVGTIKELQDAKTVFDASGLKYYLTAGDHDLWDARDKGMEPDARFVQVFGAPYRSFADSDIRFIIVYNSDNYFGLDGLQMRWYEDELIRVQAMEPKQTILFLHEPLYHPSSDRVMGKTNAEVAVQARQMINLAKRYGVGLVVAGDTHFSSEYTEPESGLPMVVVGAVTEDRNTQAPRFAIIDVYADGSYNVTDTEIK